MKKPKGPPHMPPAAAYAAGNALRLGANLLRSRQKVAPFVWMTLDGAYPELSPPRNFFQQQFLPPAVSLRDLDKRFQMLRADRRVEGLILEFRGLSMSQPELARLRAMIVEFKASGKRVIAYATQYTTGSYMVASAADEVLLQPGGGIEPLGLRRQFTFMAEALERVGLRFDLVPISPYKSAGDGLTRRSMSDELREMSSWLLDEAYEQLLGSIVDGRDVERDAAKAIVDAAPYTDEQALTAGAVDGIRGAETLESYLGDPDKGPVIERWDKVKARVHAPRPDREGQGIALLRIEGMIVDGKSEQPPMGQPLPLPMASEPRAGDITVVEQARAALEDDRVSAVVVRVDSPGGSATASEAMAAELSRLAAKKPVVVSMGSVAASGGYYVATPAQWVMAEPSTITGSIGVISGKLVSSGLLDKLHFERETLKRGAGVDFATEEQPYTPDERQQLWKMIQRIYEVFKDRVVEGRGLAAADLERLAGGRVWTGTQAFAHGLVDELGDLDAACEKARELAGLHHRAPLRPIRLPKSQRLPLPLAAAAGAEAVASATNASSLSYAFSGLRHLQQSRALCLWPGWLVGREDIGG